MPIPTYEELIATKNNEQQNNKQSTPSYEELVASKDKKQPSVGQRIEAVGKAYLSPVIGASKFFNIPSAAIRATYDTMKTGKPLKEAYDENLKQIRDAQSKITESSMIAHYLGKGGELAMASALPAGGMVKNVLSGAYAAASEGESLEEQKKLALGGGIAGGTIGKLSNYIGSKIPNTQQAIDKARTKAMQYFDASSKFLEQKLQFVKGQTADQKIANLTDFLAKKSIAVDNGKTVNELSRQVIEARNATGNILKGLKQEALVLNNKIDTLPIYEKIKNVTVDMADQPAEANALENIFMKVHAGGKVEELGNKSLSDVNKAYEELNKQYGYLFDKFNRTPKEEKIVDGIRAFKSELDDVIEGNLTSIDPALAVQYAKIKTDYHLLEQTKELLNNKIYQKSAKQKGIEVGNIKYAGYKGIGEGVSKIIPDISPSTTTLRKVAPYTPAIKSVFERGQKIPWAIGINADEVPQE